MQGKERTRPSLDLGHIFYNIRTIRCIKTRRSWQRRARLALAQRLDLTPAERHEIMCVWSLHDSHTVRSPALAKLLGSTINAEYQHKQPTLRAAFDAQGQKPAGAKKPGLARLDFGYAANDAIAYTQRMPQRSQRLCIHASNAYRGRFGFPRLRSSLLDHRGSGIPAFSNDGSPRYPSRPAWQWQPQPIEPTPHQLDIFS